MGCYDIHQTFLINGRVQGSVTGPTLFSILLSQLGLDLSDIIRYADVAYLFFEKDHWEQKAMPKMFNC